MFPISRRFYEASYATGSPLQLGYCSRVVASDGICTCNQDHGYYSKGVHTSTSAGSDEDLERLDSAVGAVRPPFFPTRRTAGTSDPKVRVVVLHE
jgi:hypothetical protein